MAAFARYAVRGLGALALVAGGFGAGLLLAEATGLLHGATAEASWLVGCGLVAAGLATVAGGLGRIAARMAHAAPLLDAAPAPRLVTLHGRAGETLRVEHLSTELSGLAAAPLDGNGLFERIHVADRPVFLAALAASASDARERHANVRLRCEAQGRAPMFLALEVRIAPAAEGRTRVAWLEPAPVAAEASEAEARATEARAKAEMANDAKSSFLRAMSHELRTPLNSILGFSELLTEDVGQMDAARRADYARIIHQSGQHLLGLVNGILDLSRVEAGAYELTCEDLDVRGAVEAALEMMALEAERGAVRLVDALPSYLPPLTADPRALRQILLNLLSNAVKFTPEGGAVEVEGVVCAGMLLLKVRDTGAGMCAADVARLGEPFFQAGDMERRRAGIGLGLAVVRALVELHRGTFEVASVLGVGTCVTVSLPLGGPEGAAATPLPAPRRPARKPAADRRSA